MPSFPTGASACILLNPPRVHWGGTPELSLEARSRNPHAHGRMRRVWGFRRALPPGRSAVFSAAKQHEPDLSL